MVLLAYTIFTTTLVLQRKQAARGLALGLASLTIPLVPLLALSRLLVEAVFVAALGLAALPRPPPPRGPHLPERAVRPPEARRHDRGPGRYPHPARGPGPPIRTIFRPHRHPPTRHRGNHVSKASRRRQRPGTNPLEPTGEPPTDPGARRRADDRPDRGRRDRCRRATGAGATSAQKTGPATTGTSGAGGSRPSTARRVRPARDRVQPGRPPRAPARRPQADVHGALPDGDRRGRRAGRCRR